MAKRGKDDKRAAPSGGATRRATRRAAPGEGGAPTGRSRTPAKAKPPPPAARGPATHLWIVAAGAATTLAILVFAAAMGQRTSVDSGVGPAAAPQARGEAATGALESRLAALEAVAARPGGDDPGVRADDIAAMIAPLGDRLAALEQAPGDIAARIAALEERAAAAPPGGGGGGDDAAVLAGRIDALARAAEAARAAVGALDTGLADLAARLSALEAHIAASSGTRPAMLLAVGQLRGALRGSGPFVRELGALRSIAAADAEVGEALDALAARAGGGVPTLEVLRAGFAEVAAKAVRADYAAAEGSWGERATAWLAAVVTVRRVGEVAGDATDAIVARAEARLAAGDLAAAIDQVKRLAGRPAEAAAAWLADARARFAAERALATLDARAVAALGAPARGE